MARDAEAVVGGKQEDCPHGHGVTGRDEDHGLWVLVEVQHKPSSGFHQFHRRFFAFFHNVEVEPRREKPGAATDDDGPTALVLVVLVEGGSKVIDQAVIKGIGFAIVDGDPGSAVFQVMGQRSHEGPHLVKS